MTPDERRDILWPQAIAHTPALLTWLMTGVLVDAVVREPTRWERIVLRWRRLTAWMC